MKPERHPQSASRRPILANSAPSQAGMSLISVMVSVAIFGILSLVMATAMKNTMSATKHVEDETDIQLIRRSIATSLDCGKTLAAFAARPVPVCTAADGYLDLRMKDRPGGVPAYLMRRDPTLTGPLSGSGTIEGKWVARVSCASTSLEIEIAKTKPTPSGGRTFSKSLLTGAVLDFNVQKHKLYGDGAGTLKICAEYFGSTTAGSGLVVAPIRLVKAFAAGCDAANGNECYCGGLETIHRQTAANPTGSPYRHGAASPAGTQRPRFWRGVVSCSAGQHLSVASADCGSVAGGGLIANVFLLSRASAEVSCCAYTGDGVANNTTIPGLVKAVCADDA